MGTEGYKAPELDQEIEYDAFSVDIFASGVVLFCMLAGFKPYKKTASRFDNLYKYFFENRQEIYWNII